MNHFNEFGVPLHACNGYRQDEHYWAWVRYVWTHKYAEDMLQFFAGKPSTRALSFALRNFEASIKNLAAQIDEDVYALATKGSR